MAYAGSILLVPGIGGNALSTPPTLFGLLPNLQVWLNYVSLLGGNWIFLGLEPDGRTPVVPLTGPLVPGNALRDYYSPFVQEMNGLGWQVYSARLDWRGTIADDGARLADQVRDLRSVRPISLVAHSRGGLVCRAAIQILAQSGDLDILGWCAGLGVPHYGSWESVGLLAGWNQSASLLISILDRSARLPIVGSAVDSLREVVITWPGAYQLLPSPSAPGITPEEVSDAYTSEVWSDSGVPVSASWLAYARDQWSQLPLVPLSVDWIDVVGVDIPTPTSLRIPANLSRPAGWNWTTAGDGTVPSAWAVQAGRRRITAPSSHGRIVQDGRVCRALDTALRRGLVEDVLITGPILQ